MLDPNPITRISTTEVLDSNWLNIFTKSTENATSGLKQFSSNNALDYLLDKNSSRKSIESNNDFKMDFSLKTIELKSFYRK